MERRLGPSVLICGSKESGKSSGCKILANYALQCGSTPVFVDLDLDRNELVPSGCIGAKIIDDLLISHPIPYTDKTEETLCFFNGFSSKQFLPDIYNLQIDYMAELVTQKQN